MHDAEIDIEVCERRSRGWVVGPTSQKQVEQGSFMGLRFVERFLPRVAIRHQSQEVSLTAMRNGARRAPGDDPRA
jgi:hypothetical protein